MRIVFLGNFGVSFSTESHHLKTYRKLGHQVTTLQEGRVRAESVYEVAAKADLFVWTHTHGVNTPGMGDVLKKLKREGIPSVGYHLDLWKGLEREADLSKDEYWNIEYFFTVDKLFIEDLEKLGIKAYYLPAGVVEDECYFGKVENKYPHDVIFVGSRGYHHEWEYRPKLIDWLENTYNSDFAHYGGDGLGVVRGDKLNDLYASAKVVVGDTLCIGYDYPYYLSDRIFETIGRGGFIIHPYIEGLEDLFEVNYHYDANKKTEVVVYNYGDFEGLQETIDHYLEDSVNREIIRLNGHERVKRDHTYTNRLQYLLDVIFEKN